MPVPVNSGRSWEVMKGNVPTSGAQRSVGRLLQDANDDEAIVYSKSLREDSPPAEVYSLAMDRVGYVLGEVVGISVVPVHLELIDDEPHALVHLVPNALPWWLYNQQKFPSKPIVNREELPLMAVFHVWLADIDRYQKNYMVQSSPSSLELTDATEIRILAIDHGQGGLWPAAKVGQEEDGSDLADADLGDGRTVCEGLIRDRMEKTCWAFLKTLPDDDREALYETVKAVTDEDVEQAFFGIPEPFMSEPLCELTVRQLKLRRDAVDALTEELLV